MKSVLAVILLLLVWFYPVKAQDSEPFLAVFCNKGMEWEWSKYHPDAMVSAKSWKDLHPFLVEVAEKAGNRPVVLDLDCHGDDLGLYLQYWVPGNSKTPPILISSRSDFGFIVNEIQDHLGTTPTVLTEACWSGRAYKHTIHETYHGYPPFPIYGIGSELPNFGNFVYLEYRYKMPVYYEDLRRYEVLELGPRVDVPATFNPALTDPRVLQVYELWLALLVLAN